MRKLVSNEVGSEEARPWKTQPGWWPGGPALNVWGKPSAPDARRAPNALFVCFFVFVVVKVLHVFMDQFKCRKLSSRVGAVHAFMTFTDLENHGKGTCIQTGRLLLYVFQIVFFYLCLDPCPSQRRYFDLKVGILRRLVHPKAFQFYFYKLKIVSNIAQGVIF